MGLGQPSEVARSIAMADTVVAIHQGSDESADLDLASGDLLVWIVADRGLSTTLIQAVAPALETP